MAAALSTIAGIEERLIDVLGERGHKELRRLLAKVLASTK
jgi:hypothetical protein